MNLTTTEKRILNFLQVREGEAFTAEQIAQQLNYRGTKNFKKLVKALAFLERVGEIKVTKVGKFCYRSQIEKAVGKFRANGQGFGFVEVEGLDSDLFVPPGKSGAAMHGDMVEVQIIRHVNPQTGKGSEAQVLNIVERSTQQLVGEFFAYNKDEREQTGFLGYIKPHGDYSEAVRLFVLPDGIHPADHTICVAKIKEYPTDKDPNHLVGMVAKEVGHKDAPGVDILAILFQFGIPHEFPDNVVQQAEAIAQEIDPNDLAGRRDLRNELIITIDGADAKDLDDAISLSKNPDGTFQLGVHIADVSHYVQEGTAIDREAYQRGTSVYLTDRVVPMLPQRLSNGICSLHPHEDRLAVTCEMTIDATGKVLKHQIYLSAIHSSYRMTYSDVNAILAGDEALRAQYDEIVPMLEEMAELHHILEIMRKNRGALDFDAPEAKVLVDAEGRPQEIELRERGVAERLIESFMLAANETVARTYTLKEYPFIYRIHEQPDEDRMMRFAEFVTSFGVILRGDVGTIAPKQLQTALSQVKGEPYEHAVSTMMLRSMKQAKYSENPDGHYGLAAFDYTHFTSPIRRYPDLIVHRLIHRYLKGKPTPKEVQQWEDKLPDIAEQSSKMERRAVDAERETTALKKAEFMVDKVGEQFEGRISSITSFGMFVELPNTIEGLVALKNLNDDYYEFNQAHMLLIGERKGRIFRIGQQVTIEVARVSVEEREIDFNLIDAEPVSGTDIDFVKKSLKKRKQTKALNAKKQVDKQFKVKVRKATKKSKKRK
ncbi:ribonuclease R [Aerococcaceae bacterium NML201209]|nr:ribonuclease R [Aerococcaceae bacterium NML201209]